MSVCIEREKLLRCSANLHGAPVFLVQVNAVQRKNHGRTTGLHCDVIRSAPGSSFGEFKKPGRVHGTSVYPTRPDRSVVPRGYPRAISSEKESRRLCPIFARKLRWGFPSAAPRAAARPWRAAACLILGSVWRPLARVCFGRDDPAPGICPIALPTHTRRGVVGKFLGHIGALHPRSFLGCLGFG